MNSYQKTAVFFMRLIGFAMTFVGAMGTLWFGLQSLRGVNDEATRHGPWNSLLWVVAGVAAYALSKPLGRFLGSGLD